MLFTVVVALLLVFLDWYIAPAKPGDKKDLVLAMAQILAGTALLSGLYFTWRTLQVNREGQITERFTRAIDQLGGERLEIRLGGIYALERIAKESADDYWPVMEILTAYVREHAPRPSRYQKPPPLDVQAILTVLGRCMPDPERVEDGRIDLRSTDLQRADFSGAELFGAFLQQADLRSANLQNANLQGANLQQADLQGANLQGANLQGANLPGVNLENAKLQMADLRKANRLQESLRKTNLREPYRVNLSGAKLGEAKLQEAFLRGANLQGAKLRGANLQQADLTEADLQKATLLEVKFQGADLHEADLRRATLQYACFQGVDLSKTQNLDPAQINKAYGDETTKLPDDVEWPDSWPTKTDR